MKNHATTLIAALGAVCLSAVPSMANAERIYYLVGTRHVYKIGPDQYANLDARKAIEQEYADRVANDQQTFDTDIKGGADPANESNLLNQDLEEAANDRDAKLAQIFEPADEMRATHPELQIEGEGPYQVIGINFHVQSDVVVFDDFCVVAPWPGYVVVDAPYGWAYGVVYEPAVFRSVYVGWYGRYYVPGRPAFYGFVGFHGPVRVGIEVGLHGRGYAIGHRDLGDFHRFHEDHPGFHPADRGHFGRPAVDRPGVGRPANEHPGGYGSRPATEHPGGYGTRPATEHPGGYGTRPATEHPGGYGSKPAAGTSTGYGSRPAGGSSTGGYGSKPAGGTSTGYGSRPAGGSSTGGYGSKPAGGTSTSGYGGSSTSTSGSRTTTSSSGSVYGGGSKTSGTSSSAGSVYGHNGTTTTATSTSHSNSTSAKSGGSGSSSGHSTSTTKSAPKPSAPSKKH